MNTNVSAAEQATIAYREMRRSLRRFANLEADIAARRAANQLPPNVEALLAAERDSYRNRALLFAAVYHVERDVAQQQNMVGFPLTRSSTREK